MKTPIVNERIRRWPRHERAADIWLIITIILACVGALCLAIHIPKMVTVLSEGVRELIR